MCSLWVCMGYRSSSRKGQKMCDSPQMSRKEQADCYVELYKEARRSFDTRRQYEWKLNMAWWGAIALIGVYGLKGEIKADGGSWGWILAAHIAVGTVYVFWTVGLQGANIIDTGMGHSFRDTIQRCAAEDTPPQFIPRPKRKVLGVFWGWSAWGQIFITALLLVFSFFMFTQKPSATITKPVAAATTTTKTTTTTTTTTTPAPAPKKPAPGPVAKKP